MLPRADITGTRPVVYIEPTTPTTSGTDPRQDSSRILDRIALGQQTQAAVLSRLEDGKFLVRIADTTARMQLPVGTQAGDKLSMTLVDTQPRLTFLLGQDAAGKQGAASTTLSSTGRLINHLLQTAQQDGTSATVIGKTPVVASAQGGSAQLASALYNTLAQSGLFYESHLNEWVTGKRTLQELLLEPQNKANTDANSRLLNFARELAGGRSMAELMQESQMKGGANNESMRMLTAIREWMDSGRSVSELMQTLRPAADPTQMNPDAARLINQQLDSLERQRFMWQGELWPGQEMEWEVSRDTSDGTDDDAPQRWQSVVRFELPTLGAVAATINLVDGHFYIQVRAASEETAQSLRAHGNELADAMNAAGSPLDLLTVNRDEEV